MATPRTRKTRPILAAVESPVEGDDVQPDDRGITDAEAKATLDSEKCPTCKGLGLVRKAGPKAGKHYRTLAGAQSALGKGNAVDCPKCGATGLVAGL